MRDHPEQIYTALLFPFSSSLESLDPIARIPQENGGLRLIWEGEPLQSLLIPSGFVEKNRVIFDLPFEVAESGRDDLFEVSLFTSISSETSVLIEGKKGLVFQMGEILTVCTPKVQIQLQFAVIQGKGEFLGHISYGNRPGQLACRGECLFDAYDWRIALRTLRRQGPVQIALEVKTSLL